MASGKAGDVRVSQKDGSERAQPGGLATRLVSVFKGPRSDNTAERRWHRQHNG
jgi:hypothetical protein